MRSGEYVSIRETGDLSGAASPASMGEWAQLAERYRPALVSFAERRFRISNEHARELTNEVIAEWLVRASEHEGNLGCKSAEHFLAILCANLNRRRIDQVRRTCRLGPLHEDLPEREPAMELVVLLQKRALIQEAFERLREVQRVALYALYIQGLSQEDVAARLNIDRRLVSGWKRRFEVRLAARAREVGLDD
ncbi:MAG: RNA polymerase sigma factor [Fimbriimonadaceae bacterium]